MSTDCGAVSGGTSCGRTGLYRDRVRPPPRPPRRVADGSGSTAGVGWNDRVGPPLTTDQLSFTQVPSFPCPSAEPGDAPIDRLATRSYTRAPATVTHSGFVIADSPLYQDVGRTHYLAVGGYYGAIGREDFDRMRGPFWRRRRTTFAACRDGLSNTLMFGENYGGDSSRGAPGDPSVRNAFSWIGTGAMIARYGLPTHAGKENRLVGTPRDDIPFGANYSGPGFGHLPDFFMRFKSERAGGITQFCMGDGSVQALGDVDDYSLIDLSGMKDGDVLENAAFRSGPRRGGEGTGPGPPRPSPARRPSRSAAARPRTPPNAAERRRTPPNAAERRRTLSDSAMRFPRAPVARLAVFGLVGLYGAPG